MQNIVPHGATAAEALIISSAVVQEGSPEGDAIHYFRLKNGWDYQNARVTLVGLANGESFIFIGRFWFHQLAMVAGWERVF